MRKVDTASYSAKQPRRVKPEKVDLGELPPIEKPKKEKPLLPRATEQKKKRGPANESVHADMHARMHAYMHSVLNQRATWSYSFRYPPELLEKLEEVLDQIKERYKTKLPKNQAGVAALAFLLRDFEINGEDSLLYKLLVKRTR